MGSHQSAMSRSTGAPGSRVCVNVGFFASGLRVDSVRHADGQQVQLFDLAQTLQPGKQISRAFRIVGYRT